MKNLIVILISLSVSLTTALAATGISALPDPTVPDGGGVNKSKLVMQKNRGNGANELFSLQQTIVSANRKHAMINGKMLTVGEKVDGATVISITKDKAFLQWKEKVIELQLVSQRGIKRR